MALIFSLLVAANLLDCKHNYYLHIIAEIQNPILANRFRICTICTVYVSLIARSNNKIESDSAVLSSDLYTFKETRNRCKGNQFRRPMWPVAGRNDYPTQADGIDSWTPEMYANSGSVLYVTFRPVRSIDPRFRLLPLKSRRLVHKTVRNFSFDLELLYSMSSNL